MDKEVNQLQEVVTWGDYEKEGITSNDIERAGVTFGELSNRKVFNKILEVKRASK